MFPGCHPGQAGIRGCWGPGEPSPTWMSFLGRAGCREGAASAGRRPPPRALGRSPRLSQSSAQCTQEACGQLPAGAQECLPPPHLFPTHPWASLWLLHMLRGQPAVLTSHLFQIVKELLSHGADPNLRLTRGLGSALCVACDISYEHRRSVESKLALVRGVEGALSCSALGQAPTPPLLCPRLPWRTWLVIWAFIPGHGEAGRRARGDQAAPAQGHWTADSHFACRMPGIVFCHHEEPMYTAHPCPLLTTPGSGAGDI